MSTQPEALRLADELDTEISHSYSTWQSELRSHPAADELRRLHALNAELLVALRELVDATDEHAAMCGTSIANKARAAIAKAEAK